ncbi:MAG: SIR2 family protein [Chitinophagia bacterium]|nr:SIR2 family protein [Chitinophagia bacterium]
MSVVNNSLSDICMSENDFVNHFVTNAAQLMWLLGAGTSRTAGMPTASDIVWDLKRRYYCIQENQEIRKHDVNNKAVQRKIQDYMDGKGFPQAWSVEEYSFYFNLIFGSNYSEQQKYIKEQLHPDKISLNIGHRVLAALLAMEKAKLVFTTNFDVVIETAHSQVAGKELSTFNIEGSYGALEALNAEQFPIYAKMHGDFRYQSIKNLSQDLLENDEKIKSCFLAAGNRYGLVVSGYSGRDENVMNMISQALDQNNPFPQGLFWMATRASNVAESVKNIINKARQKGVGAYIVESGTFDSLLLKIWRQLPNKPENLDKNVRTTRYMAVEIPLPKVGSAYPILRTNALPIVSCSSECAKIELNEAISYGDMRKAIWEKEAKVIITKPDTNPLAWGAEDQIRKIFDPKNIKSIQRHTIEDPASQISQNTFIKSFYEEALAKALVKDKPLLLRSDHNDHTLIVNNKHLNDTSLMPLKMALAYENKPGYVTGSVPAKQGVLWSEALKIKLEEKNGSLWLLLTPDIWISPYLERRNCIDFLKKRKLYRYNNKSSGILDAWIKILFGSAGNNEVQIQCFSDDSFKVKFIINTRTAYSKKEVANG